MAKIKHIALTTKEPTKVAEFYKQAFGLEEVRRNEAGSVWLTDGYISLAVLNWKTEKNGDVGPMGPNFSGIHHFGFQVDDKDTSTETLQNAMEKPLTQFTGDPTKSPTGSGGFEMKVSGPDAVVIELSDGAYVEAPMDPTHDRHSL
jgi:catechol-2,3-dioxygenase